MRYTKTYRVGWFPSLPFQKMGLVGAIDYFSQDGVKHVYLGLFIIQYFCLFFSARVNFLSRALVFFVRSLLAVIFPFFAIRQFWDQLQKRASGNT